MPSPRHHDGLLVAVVAIVLSAIALLAVVELGLPKAGSTLGGSGGGGGTGGVGGGGGGGGGGPSSGGGGGTPLSCLNCTTQTFSSTVDGHELSYYEWLPTGYNSGNTYPMILYLHGQTQTSVTTAGSELFNSTGGQLVIKAAVANGFIVTSLNTRTGDGWYVNSPYSGPQQTDVFDMITHEKSLRSISGVYLLGFSMGTVGAMSLAAHFPASFAGLAMIEPCTDLFETLANIQAIGQTGTLTLFETTTNGQLPSAGGYALGETYYLSAGRFFPSNLSGVPVYAVDGGEDPRCPDDLSGPTAWPYMEGNSTFINYTCRISSTMLEPSGCTTPLQNLSTAHPSLFKWRFVYEQLGTHNLNNINAADYIDWLLGTLPTGTVCAVPGGAPHNCP